MTAVFVAKSWLSPFVLRYLSFPGLMMASSKRQNGYLNQQVFLFRLQYDTHSLQMHPKLPCMSGVTPTPKLLEQQYALRLVVFTCKYLLSPLLFFQTILPSSLYVISSISLLHLLRRPIYPCCPASSPL